MNVTIKIAATIAGSIESINEIIGSCVDARVAGEDITISGRISEIITDDGTIIDHESIIIEDEDAEIESSISDGSIAQKGIAPRGSLIRSDIA